MAGSKPYLQPFSNDMMKNWPTHVLFCFFFVCFVSFFTNHVHSNALTEPLLPDIAPLPAGMFSSQMGLSWYHASIVPLPTGLFNTPTCLLAFIELPCFKMLLSINTLPAGLFSNPMSLLRIMILSIWKSIGTRAC